MIGRKMNQLVGAALLVVGLMFLVGWLVLPQKMETVPPYPPPSCPNPTAQHNIYLSNGMVVSRSSHDEAWAYAKDNPNVIKITRLDVTADPTSPTGYRVTEVVEWENSNPPSTSENQPPSTQQQPTQQTPPPVLFGLTFSQMFGAILVVVGALTVLRRK
jgi:hypothetical protein